MALIFVHSIPRESAFNIHEWTSTTSGKKLNKTKIGNATTKISAIYSTKVGGLLNYISYTPWINPETGTPFKDDSGNDLTLQHMLEKKYNLQQGYLHNRPFPPNQSPTPDKVSFFQSTYWILKDGTTVFDTNDMMGELGYYVLLASPKVANSEKEWRSHKWPKAEFYIALENETESIKYQKNEVKGRAIAKLNSSELTSIYKRKLLSLLDLSSSTAPVTDEQVYNLLFDYIDKSSFTLGSNIDKFTEVTNLLNTPSGREEFEARFLLRQALDTRVIYEKQNTYKFPSPNGEITIGERYTEAVDFFMNPKKQKEIDEIKSLIELKLK